MDPLAPDGEPKWATHGRAAPLFRWWALHGWDKVIYLVFEKIMGPIVLVNDEAGVDRLLAAEVML